LLLQKNRKHEIGLFFFQIKLINSKMLPYKQIEFKIKVHAI
jgi:hypothetical protein